MDTINPASRPRWRRIRLAALAAALALALAACSVGESTSPAEPTPPTVPVARPLQRTVPVTLELPGHVEAIERVELRARVGGHLQRIAFEEGARVEQGQLLVQIDPAPYAAAVAGAQASLKQAEAEARQAAAEAERAQRLVQRQAIPQEEVERRAAQAAVAAARRDAARATLARARLDLEHTRIVAPFGGRIGRAEVSAGNLVGSEQRLALLLADEALYVRFDVSERVLGAHPPAQWRARFTLPEAPQQVFEGGLAFVENEISAGTGSLRARLRLPGHPLLVPGRYGQVQLTLGERADALLVDEKALGADQGTRYLLVVADGSVEYRPVIAGPRVGTLRVIEQGLEPGEQVIVAGLMGVRPGMRVIANEAAGANDALAARE